MAKSELLYSRRLRPTPYTPIVESLGVSGFSVVNHTILPKGFQKSVEEDYWHLKEHVQLWDVGCQRQVELRGVDAAKLTQLMTPRDLSNAQVGDCLYAPIIDENAGMLNDPVILKLADDWFWLSISDSDLLLWAKGLAYGMNLDVKICEPDVWPMAVQGPKSDDLMSQVFGESVRDIKFFKFRWLDFEGHQLLIARSGYSKQGGFEIYLDKPEIAADLWSALWQAGVAFNVAPGCPNLIERIEGGLFSYGNEMTLENNPLECGLSEYCELNGSIDYIGYTALKKIAQQGVLKKLRGVRFDGDPCPPCKSVWPVFNKDTHIGQISSAIWSPRFKLNVALAMVDKDYWEAGTEVDIATPDGLKRSGEIVDFPM